MLVALPLLLAAFTVTRPAPLDPPDFPAAFDTAGAYDLAAELAGRHPDRSPETSGATGAATWFRDQLRPYGFAIVSDSFSAAVAGNGRLRFENLAAIVPGRSHPTIVVVAHRDNTAAGSGANDNASGTAALIELARSYANPVGASTAPSTSRRVRPSHTLVFLSTDGGALGGLGARHFAERSPLARNVVAAIDLDAIAGPGPAGLEFAGDRSRFPSAELLATAAARVLDQGGEAARRPSALRQLLDLAFPFSLYEQAPLLASGVSAVTLTSGGDRPPSALGDTPKSMHARRLGEIGRAAQQLLGSLDEGVEPAESTTTYVFFGARIVRGWAIEFVLVAALLPFLVAAVDLFALTRRRRLPLAPAVRSLRSRVLFWTWVVLVFELLGFAGLWPTSGAGPPAPDGTTGTDWPVLGLVLLAALSSLGWFVTRDRLVPRRTPAREDELTGHCTALLALAIVALLTVSLNAFALIFVLPSLHAWLWLPQVGRRSFSVRLATWLVGLGGPALLVWEFAERFGLGFDAFWYLTQLAALGWLPASTLALFVVWAAAAGQLAAITAGRYAPYPNERERPPLGPLRRTLRRLVLSSRARRRARIQPVRDDDSVTVLHG